jgi:ectoine hydroxylase-related dioxygenase (phytanoyl-CoA dioxygenase family)
MLTQQQVDTFERDGYLVVNELVSITEVIEPLKREYTSLLSGLCKLWSREGALPAAAAEGSFSDMIMATVDAGIDYFQPIDISLPPGNIDAQTPFHAGPAVFDLMTHEPLLDAVESLLGPELTSNPIQHVRVKPPHVALKGAEVRPHIVATDWHQDRGVTHADADESRMVTVWVAVTDATEDNGCLQVIPGSHKQSMLTHCPASGQLRIPTEQFAVASARSLPVPAGGAVLFHPNTIHSSLDNTSGAIRWSFDLRYNVTGDSTGREFFPSFVARSRSAPDSELRSAAVWRQSWEDARDRLADDAPVAIHRWDGSSELCA